MLSKKAMLLLLKDKRNQYMKHLYTYQAWDMEDGNEHKHDDKKYSLNKKINELTRLIVYLKHDTMKDFIKFVHANISRYINKGYSVYEEEIEINMDIRDLL